MQKPFDNRISKTLLVNFTDSMSEKKRAVFVKSGGRGGKSTLEKYGKNHFSKIAKKRHRDARKRKEAGLI